MAETLPRWKSDDELAAADLNKVADAAERGLKFGVSGADSYTDSTGHHLLARGPLRCWATLGAGAGGGAYAWTESVTTGVGTRAAGQRSGTTTVNPAYEASGVSGLPAGGVVELTYSQSGGCWLFTADLCS